ncbi:MAG: CDP-glucose 4,6-dehydratase [Pedosphaera sp.]|nr:CDP-glucose 4,6-dehydratase [Pedosphaera sp.]
MFYDFYRGKRVLVTGHTGFKGGWLALWLKHLGARVSGVGLGPPTTPSLHSIIGDYAFEQQADCDVRDLVTLQDRFQNFSPDVVFHLAAQPLVRASFAAPLETLQVNALGTANVLEAIRRIESPITVIVVTTDKCYENRGWEYGYREIDHLGGHDVYSMSKAAADLIAQSWQRSFFATNPKLGNVATARAGNVIGGGDYAEDRIVPDCVRALIEKRGIVVRNPASTRPWQHVLDCLSGYLLLGARLALAEKTTPLASAFNFGPGACANRPVGDLVEEFLKAWPGQWQHVPPTGAPHEAAKLNLAIDKAAALLNWFPVWLFEEAVLNTATWYHERHLLNNPRMVEFSLAQIESFTNAARKNKLAWAQTSA